MSRTLGSCTVLLALTFVCGLAAQAPPEKNADKGDVPKEKVNKENDPTQPSDQLKMLMMKSEDTLPAITLVAKVIAKNRPPLAIVRIGDRELLVSKNSTIEFPKNIMKVVDITYEELRLEWQQGKLGNKAIILK